MGRAKKYHAFTRYLLENGGQQVTLTFTQMNELLFPFRPLPVTALTSLDFWSNDVLQPQNGAYGWLDANYEVILVNLEKEFVVFKKNAAENR